MPRKNPAKLSLVELLGGRRSTAGAVLTVPQAARELRVSPDTVRAWCRSGQLPAANLASGKRPRWAIQRSDLEAFLRSRQQPVEATRTKRRKPVGSFKRYRT